MKSKGWEQEKEEKDNIQSASLISQLRSRTKRDKSRIQPIQMQSDTV